jgi:hypothetical protein
MSVVMGVFRTIEGVEDTAKALLDAGFTDDDIGVVVRDTQKGTVIADDLGREYASGATPRDAGVMSRTTVWDRFPEGFYESIYREDVNTHPETMHADIETTHAQREDLHTDAMTRYQQHLDRGDIVMVINTGDRYTEVVRIIREHHGELYHGGRVTGTEPYMESGRVDIHEKKRREDEAA